MVDFKKFKHKEEVVRFHMENYKSEYLMSHAKVAGNVANGVYKSFEEYKNDCRNSYGIMYNERDGVLYYD